MSHIVYYILIFFLCFSILLADENFLYYSYTDTKDNTSYNNHLTINTPTTRMTNIPEGINTCNDEEDIISFTSSITFLIDTPKITENYVDDYLRSMEKRIKNTMMLIIVKNLTSQHKKGTSDYLKPLNINTITHLFKSFLIDFIKKNQCNVWL